MCGHTIQWRSSSFRGDGLVWVVAGEFDEDPERLALDAGDVLELLDLLTLGVDGMVGDEMETHRAHADDADEQDGGVGVLHDLSFTVLIWIP